MRGDEEYKYHFGGVNRYVMRERVVKPQTNPRLYRRHVKPDQQDQ